MADLSYFSYDHFWSYIWFCSVLSVITLMANTFQEIFRLLSDFQMPGMLSMEDGQTSWVILTGTAFLVCSFCVPASIIIYSLSNHTKTDIQ